MCYWGTLGVDAGGNVAFAIRSLIPNPSAGITTIGFALPKADRVKLEVFDAAGHRVRTVADGAFGAGVHQAVWDGRDTRGTIAKPGTYFVRLSAGGRVATQKLVLRQ